MSDCDLHHTRVKELLAQDPEINDIQMKEFHMQLQESLDALEKKSKRVRHRVLISLAVYLAAMLICWFLALLWRDAAPNATAGLVRGLVYWPFVISGLAGALAGIWLLIRYIFVYAPQIRSAHFDLQTSILLELQQEVKQLRENIERWEE